VARQGKAWQGLAGMVWPGKVRRGSACWGGVRFGQAWLSRVILFLGGMKMTYQWRVGARIKADAEAVGKELDKIKGHKTPEKLVNYAEAHPKSALFSCFEWDDSTAAAKYRLEQARHVLGSLVIVKTEYAPKEKKEIQISTFKAYENVQTGQGRAYVSTPVALQTPEYKAQIFGRIRKGIDDLQTLGDTYSELLKNPKKFKETLQNALEFA
jgi:hypothetical protein